MPKYYKQILAFLFIGCLLLSSFYTVTYAESQSLNKKSEEIILFEAKEITDFKILEQKMKVGHAESKDFMISHEVISNVLKQQKDIDKDMEVKGIKQINQRLKSVRLADGTIKDSYALNSIVTFGRFEAGSKENSDWDGSYGVKMKITLYYDKLVDFNLYRPKSAKAEILEHTDSSLKIRELRVGIKYGGLAHNESGRSSTYDSGQVEEHIRTNGSFTTGDYVTVSCNEDRYYIYSGLTGECELLIQRGTGSYRSMISVKY